MAPPLIDQLRPLTTEELLARIQDLGHPMPPRTDKGMTTTTTMPSSEEWHQQVLGRTVQIYKSLPPEQRPQIRRHEGSPIPHLLQTKPLSLLQNLRWTVPNDRTGLSAERYLVLRTNVEQNDVYFGDLRQACRDLMDWADPNYYYSGIAVTHNFVSSPHIDDRDRSFQYAVSLGDFDEDGNGGELCVDGREEGEGGRRLIHVENNKESDGKSGWSTCTLGSYMEGGTESLQSNLL